ncbi:hypothetical protein HDK90DRAFT_515710 [Phyllosticta capitalensis]|uniref:RING-type domain-containing protein n=1 Tax=Phyllosticta capitalensis TaxID=121624 RepID=A0ABR1Y9M2_9PEZI
MISTLSEEDCHELDWESPKTLDRQLRELRHAAWDFPACDLSFFRRMNAPDVIYKCILLGALYTASNVFGIGDMMEFYIEKQLAIFVYDYHQNRDHRKDMLVYKKRSHDCFRRLIVTSKDFQFDLDEHGGWGTWGLAPQVWPEDEMEFGTMSHEWPSPSLFPVLDNTAPLRERSTVSPITPINGGNNAHANSTYANTTIDDHETNDETVFMAENESEHGTEASGPNFKPSIGNYDKTDDYDTAEPAHHTEIHCIATTRCGHAFCADCLDLWVEMSARCPDCRSLL